MPIKTIGLSTDNKVITNVTELTDWLDSVTLGADGSMQLAAGVSINEFSSDVTLSGDSNSAVPTEKATKTYVDTAIAGLTTNHNSLLGLQGGTTNQYYHMTSGEYTEVNAWLDNVTLETDGTIHLGDNAGVVLGAGDDAELLFDSSNVKLNLAAGVDFKVSSDENDSAITILSNPNAGSSALTGLILENDEGQIGGLYTTSINNPTSALANRIVLQAGDTGDFGAAADGIVISTRKSGSDIRFMASGLDTKLIIDEDGVKIPNQILGTPTYSTINDFCNSFGSCGRKTGGLITDAGSSKVAVTAGTGFIKATDDDNAQLMFFDWPAPADITIPADSIRYIGVEYNSGTPQVVSRTSYNWDFDSEFPLGRIVNETINGAEEIYIGYSPWWITDGMTNIAEALRSFGYIRRDATVGGLILSVTGTRNIAVTAGTIWATLDEVDFAGIDTNVSGTVEYYWYKAGTGWQVSDVTQYSVTQWNDVTQTTLQTMDNNKYCNVWVYGEMNNGTPGVALVYPQAQYNTAAEAEIVESPSNLPVHIREIGLLVGRIIIKKSVDAPIAVESAFTNVFTMAAASDHGNLTGLTDDDHTQYSLVDGTRAFTGIVSYNDGKTFTTDHQIVTKKYVDDSVGGATPHNNLTGIQGGTSDQYYHLTSGEYTELNGWLDNVTLGSDGALTLATGASVNEFSTDGTLSGDSDSVVPTEKAIKTYVDTTRFTYSGINDADYATPSWWELICYTDLTADRTLTLPTTSGHAGDFLRVKDFCGHANQFGIILDANGKTIDGQSTFTIEESYGAVILTTDGINYGIV